MERNAFYDNLRLFNEKDSLMHHGILGQKWGVRRYQNPDGSLTEEGKQRYLNPDGSLSEKAPSKIRKAYSKYVQDQSKKNADAESMKDNSVYDENKQKEKMNNAKANHMYDLNFVEAIQNAENLSDDDINREYEAYLRNPRRYMSELQVDNTGKITNSISNAQKQTPKPEPKQEQKAPVTKAKVYLDPDKDIDLDGDGKRMLSTNTINKWMEELGDKADKMSDGDLWKYIGNRAEKEMPRKVGSQNNKPTKQEKAEIKEAKKAVEKNLTGGLMSNWALLNNAMKELGISSADQKNMTAADWNRVNEKIQELKKK